MSINNYSVSESDASETNENTYCILLHIVEGIGLTLKESAAGAGGDLGNQRKNIFLLKVSLNGVQFEVEGHSLTPETAAIFNSNCIWECGLDDIKRMKTDNRPVKLECFLKYGRSKNSASKMIGSLLLPIRGVKTINNLTQSQLKFYWHKLGTLSAEWRPNRPEIYLMLMIVKKDIIEHGQLEALLGKHKRSTIAASNSDVMLSPNVSETVFMLQSQSNVYVQLLEQFGQIQVGNNPEDSEIFSVTLTFKQVKNVIGLLGLAQQPSYQSQVNCFVFQYDFFGSNSIVEITINSIDCYTINEKIALSFRSSLKSLRLYFQRIFYIPINLYYNDAAIANYQFDFSKLLPDDTYFSNVDRVWTKNGSFNFERLHKILSPRAFKPSVDFIFTIQLVIPYAKRNNYEIAPLNETYASNERERDDKLQLCGNMYQNLDMPQFVQAFKQLPFDISMTGRHLNRLGTNDDAERAAELCAKSAAEFDKDNVTDKDEMKCHSLEYPVYNKTNGVCVLTSKDEPLKTFSSIATNTDSCDITAHEELTIQIVQELEDWKSQQMENFLKELKRKEVTLLKDLQTHREQQSVILEAQLKAKMAKCDQLNAQLEKAQIELNASATKNREAVTIADTIKRDIEQNYARKFNDLEAEMQRLKLEIQQRGTVFELKNKQVLFDNTCLEMEKAELKERTEQLEKQLTMLQNTHLSADQLNDVHNDMRKQMERCVAMEKSRNFYKEQWAYASQKVNKLKVKLLKVREGECERNTLTNTGFEFCLDEILNEEQEILKSDRSELKSIKLSLLNSSDSSSPDELVSDRLT